MTAPELTDCVYFRTVMRETGLDRPAVRDACRSLAAKGLAYYARGLFTEDGLTAGSGYGCTDAGHAMVAQLQAASR